MKKVLKSVLAGVLGISMLCSVNINAKAVTNDASSEEYITAEITVPKEEVMSNISRSLESGEVEGNGVRLREKPSSSSTVLELMYDGEAVTVNSSKTVSKNGTRWYYIKRIRTGTWGYANSNYIYF